jgi:DNA-binding MarR family transcriptional regulator
VSIQEPSFPGGEAAMRSIWQDIDEVQTWSRIFLAIFVLLGLIPFFRRSYSRLLDYLNARRRLRTPSLAALTAELEVAPADPSHLNDIEYIVFAHLAQAGKKGASLRAMAQSLHMESSLIAKALQSLYQRGYVAIVPGFTLVRRFALSQKGEALALEKGLASPMRR